jgi:hypothetical protein
MTQEVPFMTNTRRQLIQSLTVAATALAATPFLALAQWHPSPNAPNPNAPHRIGDPEPTVGEKRPIDQQNLSQIRLEVQKLQDMVNELKDDVDHINPNATLSVSFVKKTQQVEKLAKQIKDHAKG